jgi:hypothetical protein
MRDSLLVLTTSTLATSEFLFAPLPTLVAGLLPGTTTSLHGTGRPTPRI